VGLAPNSSSSAIDSSGEWVRDFFGSSASELQRVKDLAAEMTRTLEILDPLFDEYTRGVCPSCVSVCCINRHSYYDPEDLIYLYASGEEMPCHRPGIPDTDPCQFLGSRGCTIRRRMRPYRCTWYFCEPLLTSVSSTPAAPYRGFIRLLEVLSFSREEMIREFRRAAGEKGFSCLQFGME